jgi:hypothetical protein
MTTDPATEPLRFAYWVPNVSGGLVTSTIEQRTDRDVIPIVRALEVEAGLDPAAVPDRAAGLPAADPVLVGAR